MNNELDILFDNDISQEENVSFIDEHRNFNFFALKSMICLLIANFSLPQG